MIDSAAVVPGWPCIADAGRRTDDRNSASGTAGGHTWHARSASPGSGGDPAPRGAVSRVRGSWIRSSRPGRVHLVLLVADHDDETLALTGGERERRRAVRGGEAHQRDAVAADRA